jgi:hypothetical protein
MAWLSGKKVDALWSNEQESNVHAWIDGAWRKLEDNHADACTNFAILAAHAKNDNRDVDARVEGGRVKEMYVW